MSSLSHIKLYNSTDHNNTILIGPLLGVESNSRVYSVCILILKSDNRNLRLEVGDIQSAFTKVPFTLDLYDFYRAEMEINLTDSEQSLSYKIFDTIKEEHLLNVHGSNIWNVMLPAKGESGNIAYTSCNGDSSEEPEEKLDFTLWDNLAQQKNHLLLMGGDQIYSDNFTTPIINDREFKVTEEKITECKQNYLQAYYLYFSRNKSVAKVLATVPSIMIWDDHDICDGWGSYIDSDKQQNSTRMQMLFTVAIQFFNSFQLRGGAGYNKNLISSPPRLLTDEDVSQEIIDNNGALKTDFSQSIIWSKNHRILALDLRAGRTPDRVLLESTHSKVKSLLAEDKSKFLLLLSSIPMAYPAYDKANKLFKIINKSKEEYLKSDSFTEYLNENINSEISLPQKAKIYDSILGLHDYLRDHWHHDSHRDEFEDLIKSLNSSTIGNKTVILSGDVHHAATAELRVNKNKSSYKSYVQLVSSGIVHKGTEPLKHLLNLFKIDDLYKDFSVKYITPWSYKKTFVRKINKTKKRTVKDMPDWLIFKRNYMNISFERSVMKAQWVEYENEDNGPKINATSYDYNLEGKEEYITTSWWERILNLFNYESSNY
ncbi:MAG: alkaline phosphatase family protein [Lentisphaeraceae bacterium]|nr:alkaline phosphatase family protein [Lentisphaeraceae bacterium]